MSFDAKKISLLRDVSGAGLKDCRMALEECGWDIDSAKDYLKKKGCNVSNKRLLAETREGLIGVRISNDSVYIIELNCQTDFVARNTRFSDTLEYLLEVALNNKCASSDSLLACDWTDGFTIDEYVKNQISVLGENLRIGSFSKIDSAGYVPGVYLHGVVNNGFGKMASVVLLKSASSNISALANFGKELAMHIVAFKPEFISQKDVPPSITEKEIAICKEQFAGSNKPDSVIEKIVQGKMEKYYADMVLLDQPFVLDDSKKVSAAIDAKEKELGTSIEVASYKIFVCGE